MSTNPWNDAGQHSTPVHVDGPGMLRGSPPIPRREAGCGMSWEIGIGMYTLPCIKLGFLGGAVIKTPSANAGNVGSIPGSRRSPEGGNGNLHWCSCLENSMHRGALRTAILKVAKSQIQPSTHSCAASSVV